MSSGSAAYDLEQMKAGALLHVKYNPTSWKRDNIFQLEQNNSNNVLTEQNELLRENESESSLDSSETESDNQGEDDNGEKVSLQLDSLTWSIFAQDIVVLGHGPNVYKSLVSSI